MAAPRVRRPSYAPMARRYVDRVIQLAAALFQSGHSYNRDGQIYFRGYPAIPAGAARRSPPRCCASWTCRPHWTSLKKLA